MKKWMIIMVICILSISGCDDQKEIKNEPTTETDLAIIQEDFSYKVNESPDKKIEVFITKDQGVALRSGDETKVIYKDYPVIEEIDPYSIYSFDEYLISWSDNSRYLFINDSIYDVAKDQLVLLEDNVVFYWQGDRGVFLAEGADFQLSYDGGIHSEFAVGKKIKAFEEGEVKLIQQVQEDRYFILDPLYVSVSILTEPQADIQTARLKYDIDKLKGMIEKGDMHQLIRENIIDKEIAKELSNDYQMLIYQIEDLEEFEELRGKRLGIEDNSQIKIDSPIDEFFEMISYPDVYFNTCPSYFYIDERTIKTDINESRDMNNLSSNTNLNTIDEKIYEKMDRAIEETEDFRKLTSKIKQLEAFKELDNKINQYKKTAPVTFETVEMFIDLVNHNDSSNVMKSKIIE